LKFLWQNNIRNIPEPLVADYTHQIGIYNFIDGEKLKSQEITKYEIKQAVDFLSNVNNLSYKVNYSDMPEASEACFSIEDYINSVEKRYSRLKKTLH
ncbi:MAG: hypothetical protein QME68_07635, partial [Elusimicrobiota bacterium]|nr:hypothetical protein [Elusimicrobiota bacterium]